MTVIEAIAREEGYGIPGAIPTRDNNPGDIIYGSFAKAHGAIQDGRFAKWPTSQDGFAAMRALLLQHYAGMPLGDALNKWAPPIENNTSSYTANVCKWTGLTPETILTPELIG
jgi:hypothetical protein